MQRIIKMLSITAVLGLVLAGLPQVKADVTPSAPTVTSLSPTSGVLGTLVTMTGTQFASSGNNVIFDGGPTQRAIISNVNSSNSTTLQFAVPSIANANIVMCDPASNGMACMSIPINSGNYNVSVQNSAGTSNTSNFTVTPSDQNTLPTLTGVVPSSAPVGYAVSLVGSNLSQLIGQLPSGGDQYGDGVWMSDSSSSALMPILPQAMCDVIVQGSGPACTGSLMVQVPSELCPGQEINSCTGTSSQTPTKLANYSIYIKSNNGANKTASVVFTVSVGPSAIPFRNIIIGSTIFRIGADGYKHPYTSEGAFLSYSYNKFSNVDQPTAQEQVLPTAPLFVAPRDGSLINDNGTVYIVTDGQRAGFASLAAFKGMGFSLSNVLKGDTSFIQTLPPIISPSAVHPNGTVVIDNGTGYLIKNGAKVGIPSMNVLSSWGYKITDTVKTNSQDQQLLVSGVLSANTGN